jgi:predicted AAA+ superfamily ATPase
MTRYRAREIVPRLAAALEDMPVVVLTGMRQTGKTTLLREDPAFAGRRYASLDDFATLEAARSNPESLTIGDEPVTIDEAQKAPEIFDAIKIAVDRRRRAGQFLLSGSASFHLLDRITESLAGRVVHFTLQPMSRRELRGDSGDVPVLKRIFDQGDPGRVGRIEAVGEDEVLRGGMPVPALGAAKSVPTWFRGFEQTYLERDLRDLAQVADLGSFRTLLKLAALRTGKILNQSALARDAKLSSTTTSRHLGLLEASFVVTRLLPQSTNRTSRLVKAPKLFVADSGLAAHLAGVTAIGAAADEPLSGALLETFVHQNLAVILECAWPGAELAYWHVQGRHEVDFIVRAGRDTLAIEVKSGTRWSEADLRGLRAYLDADRRCRAAILAYEGSTAASLGDRLWALPIGHLLR